ncbi:MAG: DUF327 family protein [Deltaproteobacteria bacterium]|nr:DUF327 family protein [Deltaproteobacteria bacterium]
MADSIDKLKKSTGKSTARSGSVKRTPGSESAGVENGNNVGQTQFRQILDGVTGDEAERKLGKILEDIKSLSGILARKRLLEDLEDYRSKVSEFLKVYMDDVLDVRLASGRRGFSRRKQVLVVKKVDVELEELTKMVLGGAQDFEIMKEMGTIEGLLMDLYR